MRQIKFKTILVLLVLQFNIVIAQERYFTTSGIIGSSLTYIAYSDETYLDRFFNESVWNVNAAISINKRLYTGLQLLNIYTSGRGFDSEHYYMYGLFNQVNFLTQTDMRLFGEISINRTDYCVCGDDFPYRDPNLYYVGLGIGFDYPLNKFLPNLYLDISALNYVLINPPAKRNNFTQYIIGLNYRLHE